MFTTGIELLSLAVVFIIIKQGFLLTTQQPENCMCADWEQWTGYGPCTAHCGGGRKYRNRTRKCKDLNFNNTKETTCINNITQFQVCNTQECGCAEICTSWGVWNDGECSLKCGGGSLTATRTRQCQGSIGCPEKQQTNKTCNKEPCAGCSCSVWSQWSEYGSCSTSCGNGEQRRNRTRECLPKLQCEDAVVEYATSECNLGVCCEDACTPWSQWKSMSCSASCDFGTASRKRSRICALNKCTDEQDGVGPCKSYTCPDTCDSTCTTWGTWKYHPCSKSCGGGTRIRKRTRNCTFHDCLEDDIHSGSCNNFQCIDCDDKLACSVWSEWSNGNCSVTCDVGTRKRVRSRVCHIPGCKLEESYDEVCKLETCEETCHSACLTWSPWYEGQCSHTCDNGTRIRHRNRTCPYHDCKMKDETTVDCIVRICPATCSRKFCSPWSGWKSSYCSLTCGGGTLHWSRVRQCDNSDCPLSETTTSHCNTHDCNEKCGLLCSPWSKWKDDYCSVSCGIGIKPRHRTRFCSSNDCETLEEDLDRCSVIACPETCFNCTTWSGWERRGNCSAMCGNGTVNMTRTRSCAESGCMTEDMKVTNCTESCTESHPIVVAKNTCKEGSKQYIAHPTECTMFIQCANGQEVIMQCPETTGWNVQINACDHKWKIPGCS